LSGSLVPPRRRRLPTATGAAGPHTAAGASHKRLGGSNNGARVAAGFGVSLVLLAILLNSVYIHSQISNSPPLTTLTYPQQSSPSLERRRTQGLPESVVLERLQREFEETWAICRNTTSAMIPANLRRRDIHEIFPPPPPFLQALRAFSSTHQESTVETCYLPATSSRFEASAEFIVIFPTDSLDARTIFLNCLKWLWDVAAVELWLLVTEETRVVLQLDTPYGNRILAWHERKDHPVHIIYASTLWDAMKQVNSEASMMVSAVFWVNEAWQGNQDVFQSGFDEWRLNSSTLVASQGWVVDVLGNNTLQHAHDAITTTVCSDSDSFPTTLRRITTADENIIPSVVDLIGSFHHRNYLCFLQHSVLVSVQANTHDWQEAQSAVAFWLTQVTGRSPRIFPSATSIKTQNGTPSLVVDGDMEYTSLQDGFGRKRLSALVARFGGVTLHSASPNRR